MYELGQTLNDGVEELEERFESDGVTVSHHGDTVSFQITWDSSETEMTELLQRSEDVLENKLPPGNEPDNVSVSGFEDTFSLTIGYDYGEDEDETDNEDTQESEEE